MEQTDIKDKKTASKPKRRRYRSPKHLLLESQTEQIRHGKAVSNLAYEIGREMGLSDRVCNRLIIAGYFHDIGKTEIIRENKGDLENRLVIEEMNSILSHPRKGYEILKRYGYGREICESVLYHHENFDGSGYPENLEGWNIPVGACILRVCDVFCALTADRPYRSAFSPETAVRMMIDEIRIYDIRVFLAFLRVIHRGEDGTIRVPDVSAKVRGVWRTL